MKIFLKRKLALFLVISILIPYMWNQNMAVANAAATPSFNKTKLDFSGKGETYSISIKNKVARSKYKWTTSNSKVAKVNTKGLVTAVGTGTATIKCVITYPSKKTKSLSCKVTVRIPATAIEIKHGELKNNAYDLLIGGTVDLDAVLTPSNSTDVAYWYIDKDNILSNPDCISLDANNKGIVTGVKAGKAVVRVKAVRSATADAAANSDIDDSIIINVTAPTATVSDVTITGSNTITIKFDSPVKKDTVITSSNTLSPNISIKMGKDIKNVLANDPGTLTPSLSADLKTLTITTANTLKGSYGISVTKAVLTTNGVPLEDYYKEVNYIDTDAPNIANVTLDETGVIVSINFTESMDFTKLKISNAKCLSSTCNPTTLAMLNNAMNYTISKDKKSLSINLATIDASDKGKLYSITISGVKDLAGNWPVNAYLTATLQTDASQRPQARPIQVVRTGYDTITATFDRAIRTEVPGSLQVSGNVIPGVVNPDNTKQVNYLLPSYIAALSGVNSVSIYGWDSYNVIASDTSAMTPKTFSVNFTTDSVPPALTSYNYDETTGILTLTYTEKVTLSSSNIPILSTLTTTNGEVYPQNVNYTQVPDTDDNVIYLQLNLPVAGKYEMTLMDGFVTDSFMNRSASRTGVTISNISALAELPAPVQISQNSANLSQIFVRFKDRLDSASAQNAANYKIPGVNIISAVFQENTVNGAVVILTVPDGSIDERTSDLDRPIYISGVSGYNGSYSAITYYSGVVSLKENVRPTIVSTVFDSSSTSKNVVKMTFSEEVVGTLTASITQKYGTTSVPIGCSVSVSGKVATLTLNSVPPVNSYLYITITSNSLKDLSGNTCQAINQQGASVYY